MTDQYFDFVNVTSDKLYEYKDDIIKSVTGLIDRIVLTSDELLNFENIIRPLLDLENEVEPKVSIFGYVTNFYEDKALIDLATRLGNEISKFYVEQFMRDDLYTVVKKYYDGVYKNETSFLTREEVKIVEDMIIDFRRGGSELSSENKIIAGNLRKEINEMCMEFNTNVSSDTSFLLFTENELYGIPESWFNDDNLAESTPDKKVYRVLLKNPDYGVIMDYVHSESVRKSVYLGYTSKCVPENIPLFEKTIRARYELAKLLGYNTHADYVLEQKMVNSSNLALEFEYNLKALFEKVYLQEMTTLYDFALNNKIIPLSKSKKCLDPWDMRIYLRLYEESVCNISLEEIKNYFPIEKVKEGMFYIYETLLNIKFERVETNNVWHKSVILYKVIDLETDSSDKLLGYFYLDMHPRKYKFSHAAAFPFQTGCLDSRTGKRIPHIVTIACNFDEKDCISFDDVETFFHEFGHVMHQICSKPQIKKYSGFNVEQDFVEVPSQMFEHWCYTKEALELISSHKETGKTIPMDLIEKIAAKKKVNIGYNTMKQIMYGIFDLTVHTINFDIVSTFSSKDVWASVEKEILGKTCISDNINPVATFCHFMGGYDAGYYGYLRSVTYATNIFYKKFKDGKIMDKNVGVSYRKQILEPGSSMKALDMLIDFLGELPNDKYYLIDSGIYCEAL